MGGNAIVEPILNQDQKSGVLLAVLGSIVAAVGLVGFVIGLLFQSGVLDSARLIAYLERFASDGTIASPRLILGQAQLSLLFGALTGIKLALDQRRFFSTSRLVCGAWFVAVFMIISSLLSDDFDAWLHGEDRFFEYLTVVLLLCASLMLATAGRSNPLAIRVAAGSLAIGCFVVAMEEISWGQRLFGWSTPDAWRSVNDQGETNIHNLFTPYLAAGYFAVISGVSWIILFRETLMTWAERLGFRRLGVALLPDNKMYQLGPVLGLVAVYALLGDGREAAEEVCAVAGFVYAFFVHRNLSGDGTGARDNATAARQREPQSKTQH